MFPPARLLDASPHCSAPRQPGPAPNEEACPQLSALTRQKGHVGVSACIPSRRLSTFPFSPAAGPAPSEKAGLQLPALTRYTEAQQL